jgi:flavin-dependent dehydrogenase
MWDAIVAGAGPAGAVAAFVLAREGHRTLLADRLNADVCKIGDALPGAAERLLQSLGLPALQGYETHARIGGNLASWNSDALVATDFVTGPAGPGWRLDRVRFDTSLRVAAIQSGAIFHDAQVRDLRRDDAGWEVRFDDGHVARARWIVDATGRRAAIARRLGIKQTRAARLIAFYAIGDADPDFHLSRNVVEAVPDGWWYAARLPSGVPIAGFHTHVRKDARFDRDAWARAFAGTRHISAMLRPTQFEQTLRALDAGSARLPKFCGEGWIACGDAAMSFDPISGQGIFSALHSGMKSGQAVAASLGGDLQRFEEYARQMDDVWTIYRMRAQAVYRSERRWVDEPFWSLARQ